ncbi:hypothetical protein LCGC14_2371770 [marine sediment metagenome]|uniref:DUF4760 domain-containing protein n=1 Tax=marine sediment metagenome TaxID=412755 RepID=A0A0F9C3K1_9ZZZZ
MGDKEWWKIHWPVVAIGVLLVAAAIITVLLLRSMQNDTPGQVGAIVDLWMLAISSSALIMVYYQLKLHRRERAADWERQLQALRADHERRKKQATIEVLGRVSPLWRKLRKDIEDGLKIKRLEILNKDHVDTIKNTPQLQDWTAELLNSLERVATGVNCKVFDIDLLFRCSATYLRRLYEQYETYITEKRQPPSTTYSEFAALMEELDRRRTVEPDRKAEVRSPG